MKSRLNIVQRCLEHIYLPPDIFFILFALRDITLISGQPLSDEQTSSADFIRRRQDKTRQNNDGWHDSSNLLRPIVFYFSLDAGIEFLIIHISGNIQENICCVILPNKPISVSWSSGIHLLTEKQTGQMKRRKC